MRVVEARTHPTGPAGHYEVAFRVIGRYMDDQKPRDVFFFEQDGAFVLRLLMSGQAGSRHHLAEFTRDDINDMVARGPSLRHAEAKPGDKRRCPARRQEMIDPSANPFAPGGRP